jgi:hypothetical protein
MKTPPSAVFTLFAALVTLAFSFSSAVCFADRVLEQKERDVQKLVAAYFAADGMDDEVPALEQALDSETAAVRSSLTALAQAVQKTAADSERGILRFKEPDYVAFTVAVAVADANVIRSTLTRLRTALDGEEVSNDAAAMLQALTRQSDDLISSIVER